MLAMNRAMGFEPVRLWRCVGLVELGQQQVVVDAPGRKAEAWDG